MIKEEFTYIFNMGRSYSDMPYGFNEAMKQHWKYNDADEAFAIYKSLHRANIVGQSDNSIDTGKLKTKAMKINKTKDQVL